MKNNFQDNEIAQEAKVFSEQLDDDFEAQNLWKKERTDSPKSSTHPPCHMHACILTHAQLQNEIKKK